MEVGKEGDYLYTVTIRMTLALRWAVLSNVDRLSDNGK